MELGLETILICFVTVVCVINKYFGTFRSTVKLDHMVNRLIDQVLKYFFD